MSSPLAIAGVTAVLRDLLSAVLGEHDVSGAIGGNVSVSALPPDRVAPTGGEPDRLNLFLHHVTRNTGWSNVGLPSRDARGDRTTNPPLALDLHYLLTAYGSDALHAEILLGYGMHVLHENPVLTRGAIRHALEEGGSLLPPGLSSLEARDLADQVELVKVTPVSMGLEEMARLWSTLGGRYRPTAAYVASVVLIEARTPTRDPLPVLSRGPVDPVTGRDAGVRVQAGLLPPFPTLEAVVLPARQVAARMGETVRFEGHHLDAPQVAARFTDARGQQVLELPTANAGPAGFDVTLPPVPASGTPAPGDPLHPERWRIGHHRVAAALRDPNPAVADRSSNELALTLAPRIDGIVVSAAGERTTVRVDVAPPVWRGQRVALLLGSREIPAEPFDSDRISTLGFTAPTASLPTGRQWVRLVVDGVSSVLIDRSGPFPRFDPSQSVTL